MWNRKNIILAINDTRTIISNSRAWGVFINTFTWMCITQA